jgi:hypothetical protein
MRVLFHNGGDDITGHVQTQLETPAREKTQYFYGTDQESGRKLVILKGKSFKGTTRPD